MEKGRALYNYSDKFLKCLESKEFTEEHHTKNMFMKIIDGVLVGEYYPPQGDMSLEFVERAYAERMKFTNGRKFPVLINVKHMKNISHKARVYSARPDVATDITKGALLVDSKFSMFIANFWLKINKPLTPTKLFVEEEEALDWLKSE